MKPFTMLRAGGPPRWSYGSGLDPAAGEVSRRRLWVFGGVFLGVLLIGLVYTFARPAQYRAVARLQITPPVALEQAATPPSTPGATTAPVSAPAVTSPEPAQPLLGEIQILTSRPLLEQMWERLQRAGGLPADLGGESLEA